MITNKDRERMMKGQPSRQVWGWVEILFYFGTEQVLKSEEHIRAKDYMPWPSLLPAAEFYGPYDVYESTFREEKVDPLATADMDPSTHAHAFGMPRLFAEYDIINVNIRSRSNKITVTSMMLINEQQNLHLLSPKTRLQFRPGRELAGLDLKNPVLPKR